MFSFYELVFVVSLLLIDNRKVYYCAVLENDKEFPYKAVQKLGQLTPAMDALMPRYAWFLRVDLEALHPSRAGALRS